VIGLPILSSGKALHWNIADKCGKVKALPEGALKEATKAEETRKAKIRARVEHPFRVVKRQFGHVRGRYRGLVKSTAQLMTLFALSSLWMARGLLLAMAGKLRLPGGKTVHRMENTPQLGSLGERNVDAKSKCSPRCPAGKGALVSAST
jgi:hypothetical protein